MDWTQIGVLVGAISVFIAVIGLFANWMGNRFTRIDKQFDKVDSWVQHLTAMQAEQSKRMDQANFRMDQLYNMFYDVVKKAR